MNTEILKKIGNFFIELAEEEKEKLAEYDYLLEQEDEEYIPDFTVINHEYVEKIKNDDFEIGRIIRWPSHDIAKYNNTVNFYKINLNVFSYFLNLTGTDITDKNFWHKMLSVQDEKYRDCYFQVAGDLISYFGGKRYKFNKDTFEIEKDTNLTEGE